MSLVVSKVPRSLETKVRLFGFELGDLLLVFLYLSISNLFFGSTALKFVMAWMGTLALSAFLHFAKRGKPDHHLQHYGEFLRTPDVLSAGVTDLEYLPYLPLCPKLENVEITDSEENYEEKTSPITRSG